MSDIHILSSESSGAKCVQVGEVGAPGAMYAEIQQGHNGINWYLEIDAVGPFETSEQAFEALKMLAAALAPK